MNYLTEKQESIINTSLEIILKKGIRSLTVKNIADKIGITDAAIYKHFKSKNEILLGVTKIFKKDSTKLLEEILTEKKTSIEKIKGFFLNRCLEFSKNKLLTIILFSDDLFGDENKILNIIHSIIEEHKNLLSVSIKEGQKMGEIRNDIISEHLFMMIMGTLRLHVIKWRVSDFSFDLHNEGKILWRSIEKIIRK